MAKTKTAAGPNGYRPNLLILYRGTAVLEIQKKMDLSHPLEVSRLDRIVLNVGVGRAKDEPGTLEHAMDDLTAISGQRPVVTRARRAISNFKIRAGDPVGCRVTLRGWRMYEFLERLVKIALPRVRDFNGFSRRSFDGRGNFHFGLEEQIVFPEIDYDKIDKIRGLNVSIVTTAESDEEGYELLRALGFPFRERVPSPSPESITEKV